MVPVVPLKDETYVNTLLGRAKGFTLDITSHMSSAATVSQFRPYTEQIEYLAVSDHWEDLRRFSEAISGPHSRNQRHTLILPPVSHLRRDHQTLAPPLQQRRQSEEIPVVFAGALHNSLRLPKPHHTRIIGNDMERSSDFETAQLPRGFTHVANCPHEDHRVHMAR